MSRRYGFLVVAAAVSVASAGWAQSRGDTRYLCYTRSSGFMWASQDHSCRVMVLENFGSQSRIELLENCYFLNRDADRRGERDIVDNSQLFTYRCD